MHVLMLGRLEDYALKGLDLAAKAIGQVSAHHRVDLVVRGAPAGTGHALRERLRGDAGLPGLGVKVRNFTTDPEALRDDFGTASVVLMPSRGEGFGLVGLEAIEAGVPVLVSSESGLGELIEEAARPEIARLHVVPMQGDDDRDVRAWAFAIQSVLRDREAAFARVAALRSTLAAHASWVASTRVLIAAVDAAEAGQG